MVSLDDCPGNRGAIRGYSISAPIAPGGIRSHAKGKGGAGAAASSMPEGTHRRSADIPLGVRANCVEGGRDPKRQQAPQIGGVLFNWSGIAAIFSLMLMVSFTCTGSYRPTAMPQYRSTYNVKQEAAVVLLRLDSIKLEMASQKPSIILESGRVVRGGELSQDTVNQ